MLSAWRICCARIQQRWVFAFTSFLAVMSLFAMRNCLSIAITEMVVSVNSSSFSMDETCSSNETATSSSYSNSGTYEWDEYTQGIILSSFYWLYSLSHLPGGILADKFGGKLVLGFAILWTSIFTLLIPFAVSMGASTALITIQVLIGMGEGVTFPALLALMDKWIPPQSRSKISSLVHSGAPIGTVVANCLSGVLIHNSPMGWPVVFYVFGSFGVLCFLIVVVLCYDTPGKHPFISYREKQFLDDPMAADTYRKMLIPWYHILRSVPVWACVCASIGINWSAFTMAIDLPKYMSDVLRFSIETNGFLSALPFLCSWIYSMSMSCVADWMIASGYMSIRNVRKLGSTMASIGPVFMIAASYSGCNKVVAIVLFTIAMTIMGTADLSVRVNVLDLAPNYSGTLMAITNGIGALTGITTPYVVGILTPNQTLSEWRLVFWIVFGVQTFTNLIFVIWASGEVQYWNNPEFVISKDLERKKGLEIPERKKVPDQ